MKHILILVATTFLVTACSTDRNKEIPQEASVHKHDSSTHKHDSSTEQISVDEKIIKAKALINEAKRELRLKDEYNCCIETECNTCLLAHTRCDCYDSLEKDKPVCNECYAGWQRGDGIDPDIDKNQVKTSYGGHDHSGHKH